MLVRTEGDLRVKPSYFISGVSGYQQWLPNATDSLPVTTIQNSILAFQCGIGEGIRESN